MSNIRAAQNLVFENLQREVAQFNESLSFNKTPDPSSKEIFRLAQNVRWQAAHIARLARAIEVLESCEPRPNR